MATHTEHNLKNDNTFNIASIHICMQTHTVILYAYGNANQK